MLAEQDDKCAICRQTEISYGRSGVIKNLAVDHDKETGKIRGLLCQRCNTGIGNLKHSIEYLRSAIEYLERTA